MGVLFSLVPIFRVRALKTCCDGQHEKLLHTGEEVISGVKCAVRCDILYERLDGVAEDAS